MAHRHARIRCSAPRAGTRFLFELYKIPTFQYTRNCTLCGAGADRAARREGPTGTIDTSKGPDAVIVDETRHLAFMPCGADGVLDILSLRGQTVVRSERVMTEAGA